MEELEDPPLQPGGMQKKRKVSFPAQDSVESRTLPCNCRELHYNCDPLQCSQAVYCQPIYANLNPKYNGHSIEISLLDLAKTARQGCASCSVFIEGFSSYLSTLNLSQKAEIFSSENSIAILEVNMKEDGKSYVVMRSGENICFEFFKTQDSDWPSSCRIFEHAGDVSPFTGSESTFGIISGWIKDCHSQHLTCPESKPVKLPTRLLDVGPHNNGSECRLCITEGLVGQYLALSHCWGRTEIITTKLSTLEARKSSITRNELSQTFRDAVEITRRLGFRYLWIDSLCIIQDDPADWKRESSNMCSIYEQCFLMISATHGADGDAGCFTDIPDAYRSYKVPGSGGLGQSGILMRKISSHHVDFANSSLYEHSLFTRAWALQERLLAPRIIHYTGREIIWECCSSAHCECMNMPDWSSENLKLSTTRTLNNAVNVHELAAQWRWLVMNYGSRELTKASDRLPALSGLAKKFSRGSLLGPYIAGLWKNDLLDGLLWSSNDGIRPPEYLAPSWSWASVISGDLYYPEYYDEELKKRCRQGGLIKETMLSVLEIEIVLPSRHADPTSTLLGGYIIVSGHLSEATLEYDPEYEAEFSTDGISKQGGFNLCKGDLFAHLAADDFLGDKLYDGQRVYCLLIGFTWTDELFTLILRRESTPNVYRRIAISLNRLGYSRMRTSGVTRDWFDDGPRRIITII